MHDIALIVFTVTYVGVALGRFPGLVIDRTGIALLGAIATIAFGILSVTDAVAAVDYSTILLLYALMIVSAQLRLGGFYTAVARRVTRLLHHPKRFLFILMLVSAALSSILVNDIVCLAFAPIVTLAVLRAGLNPIPFLLGLAVSSNIGSAATIIGNPQNMLIGQTARLDFGRFLLWCGPPSVLSLLAAYGVIRLVYRNRLLLAGGFPEPVADPGQPFNRWQVVKGLAATVILVVLFFTRLPRELTAMSVAGILLCSRRMQTARILDLVDWHLITLFLSLFVVVRGLETTGLPERIVAAVQGNGVDIAAPAVLGPLAVLLSNLVSNVPAAMLLTRFLDPANATSWYLLALATTLAGNLFVIGSIANLITIEQARRLGVNITFGEHARVGVPVTLISLAILAAWFAVASHW